MTDDAGRLAVTLTTADGSRFRWAGDEPDAANLPSGLEFGTVDPGGFKDAALSLPRRIDVDFPDLNLFDDVKVYGPGGQTAWEGRVAEIPKQHGDGFSVDVNAVGWSAHLADDPSFREIYVDRDLSHWTSVSRSRKVTLGVNAPIISDPQVAVDTATGLQGLQLQISDNWTAPTIPRSEAQYDCGAGVTVGSIYVDAATVFSPFILDLVYAPDDSYATAGFVNLITSPASTYAGTPALPSGYRVIAFSYRYNATPAGTPSADYSGWARRVAVFGNHGLTKRGGGADQGYYASDVIADIVRRGAPALTVSATSIEESQFVIPHLTFLDPVTAEDAILSANAFHQRSWGVEDDKTFFWRSTATIRSRWRARLSDGDEVDLAGPQAENAINGVIVRYEDPAGVTRTVGPTGANTDYTDSTLLDSSSDNPATAHNLRRWAILELDFVTTSSGAIQVGAVYLTETVNNANVRGSVKLKGWIRDDRGAWQPAWAARAGDTVLIEDADAVERRIVETDYDDDSRTNNCSLDTTPHKVDALLERMGVSLVGVI